MKILGIKRSTQYSPNHINNDDTIFNLTTAALSDAGMQVTVIREEEFLGFDSDGYDRIYAMARNRDVIKALQSKERNGALVINSSFGIENCYRSNVTRLLMDHDISMPPSRIVATEGISEADFEGLGHSFWIKRGDFHAIHKEDVTFVPNALEGCEIIGEYRMRGIEEAVICENLVGDLVKFYGVADASFFYWFYPYDHNHHKYREYEAINGQSSYFPFDEDELQHIAEKSSQAVDVPIYGGDAIIGAQGDIRIIDFNDWPSFAPCRKEASVAIAHYLKDNF